MCVCCLRERTHRHPPPTTTLPSLRYLPSSRKSDPAPQTMCPPPTFPAQNLSHTLRQYCRAPCRQLPLSPCRRRLARPSKPRCLAVADASPPRRHCLDPPSSPSCPPSPPPRPAVADRRQRPQRSFLRSSCRHLLPTAAAAKVRKTSRGGWGDNAGGEPRGRKEAGRRWRLARNSRRLRGRPSMQRTRSDCLES